VYAWRTWLWIGRKPYADSKGAVRPTEADTASLPYASAAPELVVPEENADLGVAPEEKAER
jgi:hypothetical protein